MEVLSQYEIDQLLTAIGGTERENEPEDFEIARSRKIKIYDFKRPDKFSRDNIRAISMIHETFARLSTTGLSALLQSVVHVHVASVDQLTYEEFIRSIPTPTTLAILNLDPLRGNAIVEIDPAITFSIIDKICGGTGEGNKQQHELTDIEQSIMEGVIIRLLGNIREAWTQVIDLRPRLGQIDTNPQFAQIVHPGEMVVLVTMETKIGEVEGMINFCLPYSTIEVIIGKLSIGLWYGHRVWIPRLCVLAGREDIPIKLTAEMFRRDYSIKEVAEWKEETVISPLRSPSYNQCFLRFGNSRVWKCQILPDHEQFPKRVKVIEFSDKPFGMEGREMSVNKTNPLVANALLDAAITISVELGSAAKSVKEILAMDEGTIIELDRLAGEPVDIKANGTLIAKGEVVVVDENFGVRVTEITPAFSQAYPQLEEDQSPHSGGLGDLGDLGELFESKRGDALSRLEIDALLDGNDEKHSQEQ